MLGVGDGVSWGVDDSRECSEEAMAAMQAKGTVAEEVVGVEGCIWNVCWRWGRSVLWMSWAWRLREVERMLRFD